MARLKINTAAVALLLLAASLASASPSLDYGGAFDKCLQFVEAQRSGKLPDDRRVQWRGDSGLTDGYTQGVDLVGGYYDAGDHVKFGFPMAYAVTMLAWGVLEFEKEMVAADQLNRALDAIRWGTNYFLKAHTKPNVLWVQVGDGDSDHLCWERAEDMSTPRTAFKIDAGSPGSDVAGETAAALAAAAKVFRHYDSMYADRLLMHAKQLFSFADTFRGKYDDSLQCAKKFYPSASGYQDELLWAAIWLYEATGDETYLDYLVRNAESLGGTGWAVREFSWDNKYAGIQVLASKIVLSGAGGDYADTLKQFQAKAEFFVCACVQKNGGNNVKITPGGLLYVADWNNMQYVSSSSFLLAVYGDYLAESGDTLNCPDGEVKPADILGFARSQADYVLGKNPLGMSYMVGNGDKYPSRVHHRGASIPSITAMKDTVGCMDGFDKYYNSESADPNVVYGALVGGPDFNDGFVDDRCNYQRAEPTLASAAPMCGVFARLTAEPAASGSGDSSPGYQPPEPAHSGAPLELVHTVTNSWYKDNVEYYRHVVTAKNVCGKPITSVNLRIEKLTGPIYGVAATQEKEMYGFPSWLNWLEAGDKITIVYIQEGGPPAKISVVDYKTVGSALLRPPPPPHQPRDKCAWSQLLRSSLRSGGHGEARRQPGQLVPAHAAGLPGARGDRVRRLPLRRLPRHRLHLVPDLPPLPPPRLRARLPRRLPPRRRVRAAAERAGDVRGALRGADERRRAQQHQHAPRRAHRLRPAPPLRLQAHPRRPCSAPGARGRAPPPPAGVRGPARRARGGPAREGVPSGARRGPYVREAARDGRPGVQVGAAGERVGPDDTELHLRHHVGAQGGRALPPRHLRGDSGFAGVLVGAGAADVPVDAAHVPRQRVELPVGDGRGGRHQRLPPPRGRRRGVRHHRGPQSHAPLRRARGAQHACQRARGRAEASPWAGAHPDGGRAAACRRAAPHGGHRLRREPRVRADGDGGAGSLVRVEGRVEQAPGVGARAAEGEAGRAHARHGRGGHRGRRDGPQRASRRVDDGRDRAVRRVRDDGVLQGRGGDEGGDPGGRVVLHGGRRGDAPGRVPGDPGPVQGRDHQRRGEHQQRGGGVGAVRAPGGERGGGGGAARRVLGRDAVRVRQPQGGLLGGDRGGGDRVEPGAHGRVHGAQDGGVPRRAAQDVHRQDSEVRAPEPRQGDGANSPGRQQQQEQDVV